MGDDNDDNSDTNSIGRVRGVLSSIASRRNTSSSNAQMGGGRVDDLTDRREKAMKAALARFEKQSEGGVS